MQKQFFLLSAVIMIVLFSLPVFSYDSYEDYRALNEREVEVVQEDVGKIVKQHSEVSGELRKNVRGEIYGNLDEATFNEIVRKAVNKEIRRIAQEEAERSVRRACQTYPAMGIWEIGGFFGGVIKSKDYATGKSSNSVNFAGVINYFFSNNIAASLKGDGNFNISQNDQIYALEFGPMFAFALDSQKIASFYVAVYGGVTVNSFLSDKYGVRYANEVGFKFAIAQGVNINVGLNIAFDNNKFNASGFETIVNPAIGVTAWF